MEDLRRYFIFLNRENKITVLHIEWSEIREYPENKFYRDSQGEAFCFSTARPLQEDREAKVSFVAEGWEAAGYCWLSLSPGEGRAGCGPPSPYFQAGNRVRGVFMLIVILEKDDSGKFVQSPANRKTYKTWDGAKNNLLGFGSSPPKVLKETPSCRVVECNGLEFLLVDVESDAIAKAEAV